MGLLNGSLKQRFEELMGEEVQAEGGTEHEVARAAAKQRKQLAISSLMKVLGKLDNTQLEGKRN